MTGKEFIEKHYMLIEKEIKFTWLKFKKRNPDVAARITYDDFSQLVFLKLLKTTATFDLERGKPATYLKIIMDSKLADLFRKESRLSRNIEQYRQAQDMINGIQVENYDDE